MILDNEEQRSLLLLIIQSTHVQGIYNEAKKAVQQLEELAINVEDADIKK